MCLSTHVPSFRPGLWIDSPAHKSRGACLPCQGKFANAPGHICSTNPHELDWEGMEETDAWHFATLACHSAATLRCYVQRRMAIDPHSPKQAAHLIQHAQGSAPGSHICHHAMSMPPLGSQAGPNSEGQ